MKNFNEKYLFEDEKYFYLYKHVDSSDGSLCILSQGTLKFTNPKNFNDPFDCKFSLTPAYLSSSKALKMNEGILFPKRSPAKRALESQRMKNFYNYNPQLLKSISEVRNSAYICCLNQNPLNILMWSHYAQQHKGFVIEFRFKKNPEFASIEKEHIFIPYPILYSPIFPKLVKKDRQTDAVANKSFLTKSLDWSYEKEWRIIRYDLESNEEIQKFPRDMVLTSVIAGIGVNNEVFLKWEKALSLVSKEMKRQVRIYKAEIIDNKYALTVPNHPRLDVSANSKKIKK